MFERFTEDARKVVVLAQDEARVLGHDYIGTEHLLLGLLRVEGAIAERVLTALNVPIANVRTRVVAIVGQSDEIVSGQIPFTPRAKKVLELSLREALSLGHNYIGAEHLLLGLAREVGTLAPPDVGVAGQILLSFRVTPDAIRSAVIRMMAREGHDQMRELHRASASYLRNVPDGRISDGVRAGLRSALDATVAAKQTALSEGDIHRAELMTFAEDLFVSMLDAPNRGEQTEPTRD